MSMKKRIICDKMPKIVYNNKIDGGNAMNNRKALFVDVDQTLFDNHRNCLYSSTVEALEKLSKQDDIDLFLATGRGINILDHLKSVLPLFKGFVTNNGQTAIYQNKLIHNGQTPKEIVKKMEDYANQNHISIAYVSEDDALVNFHNEISKKALDNFHIYNAKSLNGAACPETLQVKQFWFFASHEQIEAASAAIKELDFIKWPGEMGCDVIVKGVTKKLGIEKVIQYLGYDFANTYAIGDGDNDIGMFEAVCHSIAMGNGTEDAKRHAKYITDSIENDGFAKAIYQYLLPKEKALD